MLTCFDSSPEIYVVAALVTDIQKYVLKQQPLQKKNKKPFLCEEPMKVFQLPAETLVVGKVPK